MDVTRSAADLCRFFYYLNELEWIFKFHFKKGNLLFVCSLLFNFRSSLKMWLWFPFDKRTPRASLFVKYSAIMCLSGRFSINWIVWSRESFSVSELYFVYFCRSVVSWGILQTFCVISTEYLELKGNIVGTRLSCFVDISFFTYCFLGFALKFYSLSIFYKKKTWTGHAKVEPTGSLYVKFKSTAFL